MTLHNPFANPDTAAGYEAWYETSGRRADRQEKALLNWLLSGFPSAHSILEVGCGTGHFTRWFNKGGLQVIGLDLSRAMLNEAATLNGSIYIQGDAQELPFPAKSFDLVALITTLEFLPDPVQALIEALCVARQGLLLGMLNAQSRLGLQYKRAGGLIWESAHLFTLHELRQMLREVAGGNARIIWKTTLWPFWPGALPLPGGGFIGMTVSPS